MLFNFFNFFHFTCFSHFTKNFFFTYLLFTALTKNSFFHALNFAPIFGTLFWSIFGLFSAYFWPYFGTISASYMLFIFDNHDTASYTTLLYTFFIPLYTALMTPLRSHLCHTSATLLPPLMPHFSITTLRVMFRIIFDKLLFCSSSVDPPIAPHSIFWYISFSFDSISLNSGYFFCHSLICLIFFLLTFFIAFNSALRTPLNLER